MIEPDFKAFFEVVPAPCAIFDGDFRFVAANDRYLKTVGRGRQELIGQAIFDLFPENEERQKLVKNAIERALEGEANTLDNIVYSIAADGGDGRMQEVWWKVSAVPLSDASGTVPMFALLVEDVTQEVRSREMTEAIAAELQHRVKNVFTLALGLARLTASDHTDVETFIDAYSDRLTALSKTHDLLTGNDWDGLRMEPLLMRHLDMYSELVGGRITLSGPDMKISAAQAQALSMGVHELSTNAAKHGALADETGKIAVVWERLGATGFRLSWAEHGVRGVREPDHSGFGFTILSKVLPGQLGGEGVLTYLADGFRYDITTEDGTRQT